MGECIEENLRIRGGVQLAQVLAEQFLPQGRRIGQVAVMPEGDAERRVDIKGLGFGPGIATGGGVSGVADAHGAFELQHMPGVEHIPHQAVVLAQIHPIAVAGDDAGGVLTPVLDDGQAVVQGLIDRVRAENSDDAAHQPVPPLGRK